MPPAVAVAIGVGGATIAGSILTGRAQKKASRVNAERLRVIGELNFQNALRDSQDVIDVALSNSEAFLTDAKTILELADLQASNIKADADAVIISSEEEAERSAIRDRRILGSQRVAFAGSGVVGAGSPIIIAEESVNFAKRNVANILNTGRTRMNRLLSQARAVGVEARANVSRFKREAESILNIGKLRSGQIIRGGQLARETGQRGAEVSLAEGRALARGTITRGITSGISTGISIGTAFG